MLEECDDLLFMDMPILSFENPQIPVEYEYQKERNCCLSRFIERINALSSITTLINDTALSNGIPKEVLKRALMKWNPFFKFEYALKRVFKKEVFEIDTEDVEIIRLLQRFHFNMVCSKTEDGFLKIVDNTVVRSENRKFIFPQEKKLFGTDLKDWYLKFKINFYDLLRTFVCRIKVIPHWSAFNIDIYDEIKFNLIY